MTLFHAVVWIDHQKAQILQFDQAHVQASRVKTHSHHTAQHGSAVRSEHEFFADVCNQLKGIAEVLVVGPRTGRADFEHYIKKHRPDVQAQVVGFETADHPTDNQLVALARKFFLKHDRMSGTPTPS